MSNLTPDRLVEDRPEKCRSFDELPSFSDNRTAFSNVSPILTNGGGHSDVLTPVFVNGESQSNVLSPVRANGERQSYVLSPVRTNGESQSDILTPVRANVERQSYVLSPVRANGEGESDVLTPVLANGERQSYVLSPVRANGEGESDVLTPVLANGEIQSYVLSPVRANGEGESDVLTPVLANGESPSVFFLPDDVIRSECYVSDGNERFSDSCSSPESDCENRIPNPAVSYESDGSSECETTGSHHVKLSNNTTDQCIDSVSDEADQCLDSVPDEADQCLDSVPDEADQCLDSVSDEVDQCLDSVADEADQCLDAVPDEIDHCLDSVPDGADQCLDSVPDEADCDGKSNLCSALGDQLLINHVTDSCVSSSDRVGVADDSNLCCQKSCDLTASRRFCADSVSPAVSGPGEVDPEICQRLEVDAECDDSAEVDRVSSGTRTVSTERCCDSEVSCPTGYSSPRSHHALTEDANGLGYDERAEMIINSPEENGDFESLKSEEVSSDIRVDGVFAEKNDARMRHRLSYFPDSFHSRPGNFVTSSTPLQKLPTDEEDQQGSAVDISVLTSHPLPVQEALYQWQVSRRGAENGSWMRGVSVGRLQELVQDCTREQVEAFLLHWRNTAPATETPHRTTTNDENVNGFSDPLSSCNSPVRSRSRSSSSQTRSFSSQRDTVGEFCDGKSGGVTGVLSDTAEKKSLHEGDLETGSSPHSDRVQYSRRKSSRIEPPPLVKPETQRATSVSDQTGEDGGVDISSITSLSTATQQALYRYVTAKKGFQVWANKYEVSEAGLRQLYASSSRDQVRVFIKYWQSERAETLPLPASARDDRSTITDKANSGRRSSTSRVRRESGSASSKIAGGTRRHSVPRDRNTAKNNNKSSDSSTVRKDGVKNNNKSSDSSTVRKDGVKNNNKSSDSSTVGKDGVKNNNKSSDSSTVRKDGVKNNNKSSDSSTVRKDGVKNNNKSSDSSTVRKDGVKNNNKSSDSSTVRKDGVKNNNKSSDSSTVRKDGVKNSNKSSDSTPAKKEGSKNNSKFSDSTPVKKDGLKNNNKSSDSSVKKDGFKNNNKSSDSTPVKKDGLKNNNKSSDSPVKKDGLKNNNKSSDSTSAKKDESKNNNSGDFSAVKKHGVKNHNNFSDSTAVKKDGSKNKNKSTDSPTAKKEGSKSSNKSSDSSDAKKEGSKNSNKSSDSSAARKDGNSNNDKTGDSTTPRTDGSRNNNKSGSSTCVAARSDGRSTVPLCVNKAHPLGYLHALKLMRGHKSRQKVSERSELSNTSLDLLYLLKRQGLADVEAVTQSLLVDMFGAQTDAHNAVGDVVLRKLSREDVARKYRIALNALESGVDMYKRELAVFNESYSKYSQRATVENGAAVRPVKRCRSASLPSAAASGGSHTPEGRAALSRMCKHELGYSVYQKRFSHVPSSVTSAVTPSTGDSGMGVSSIDLSEGSTLKKSQAIKNSAGSNVSPRKTRRSMAGVRSASFSHGDHQGNTDTMSGSSKKKSFVSRKGTDPSVCLVKNSQVIVKRAAVKQNVCAVKKTSVGQKAPLPDANHQNGSVVVETSSVGTAASGKDSGTQDQSSAGHSSGASVDKGSIAAPSSGADGSSLVFSSGVEEGSTGTPSAAVCRRSSSGRLWRPSGRAVAALGACSRQDAVWKMFGRGEGGDVETPGYVERVLTPLRHSAESGRDTPTVSQPVCSLSDPEEEEDEEDDEVVKRLSERAERAARGGEACVRGRMSRQQACSVHRVSPAELQHAVSAIARLGDCTARLSATDTPRPVIDAAVAVIRGTPTHAVLHPHKVSSESLSAALKTLYEHRLIPKYLAYFCRVRCDEATGNTYDPDSPFSDELGSEVADDDNHVRSVMVKGCQYQLRSGYLSASNREHTEEIIIARLHGASYSHLKRTFGVSSFYVSHHLRRMLSLPKVGKISALLSGQASQLPLAASTSMVGDRSLNARLRKAVKARLAGKSYAEIRTNYKLPPDLVHKHVLLARQKQQQQELATTSPGPSSQQEQHADGTPSNQEQHTDRISSNQESTSGSLSREQHPGDVSPNQKHHPVCTSSSPKRQPVAGLHRPRLIHSRVRGRPMSVERVREIKAAVEAHRSGSSMPEIQQKFKIAPGTLQYHLTRGLGSNKHHQKTSQKQTYKLPPAVNQSRDSSNVGVGGGVNLSRDSNNVGGGRVSEIGRRILRALDDIEQRPSRGCVKWAARRHGVNHLTLTYYLKRQRRGRPLFRVGSTDNVQPAEDWSTNAVQSYLQSSSIGGATIDLSQSSIVEAASEKLHSTIEGATVDHSQSSLVEVTPEKLQSSIGRATADLSQSSILEDTSDKLPSIMDHGSINVMERATVDDPLSNIEGATVDDSQFTIEGATIDDSQSTIEGATGYSLQSTIEGATVDDSQSTIEGATGDSPQSTIKGATADDSQSTIEGATADDSQSTIEGATADDSQSTIEGATVDDPQSTIEGAIVDNSQLSEEGAHVRTFRALREFVFGGKTRAQVTSAHNVSPLLLAAGEWRLAHCRSLCPDHIRSVEQYECVLQQTAVRLCRSADMGQSPSAYSRSSHVPTLVLRHVLDKLAPHRYSPQDSLAIICCREDRRKHSSKRCARALARALTQSEGDGTTPAGDVTTTAVDVTTPDNDVTTPTDDVTTPGDEITVGVKVSGVVMCKTMRAAVADVQLGRMRMKRVARLRGVDPSSLRLVCRSVSARYNRSGELVISRLAPVRGPSPVYKLQWSQLCGLDREAALCQVAREYRRGASLRYLSMAFKFKISDILKADREMAEIERVSSKNTFAGFRQKLQSDSTTGASPRYLHEFSAENVTPEGASDPLAPSASNLSSSSSSSVCDQSVIPSPDTAADSPERSGHLDGAGHDTASRTSTCLQSVEVEADRYKDLSQLREAVERVVLLQEDIDDVIREDGASSADKLILLRESEIRGSSGCLRLADELFPVYSTLTVISDGWHVNFTSLIWIFKRFYECAGRSLLIDARDFNLQAFYRKWPELEGEISEEQGEPTCQFKAAFDRALFRVCDEFQSKTGRVLSSMDRCSTSTTTTPLKKEFSSTSSAATPVKDLPSITSIKEATPADPVVSRCIADSPAAPFDVVREEPVTPAELAVAESPARFVDPGRLEENSECLTASPACVSDSQRNGASVCRDSTGRFVNADRSRKRRRPIKSLSGKLQRKRRLPKASGFSLDSESGGTEYVNGESRSSGSSKKKRPRLSSVDRESIPERRVGGREKRLPARFRDSQLFSLDSSESSSESWSHELPVSEPQHSDQSGPPPPPRPITFDHVSHHKPIVAVPPVRHLSSQSKTANDSPKTPRAEVNAVTSQVNIAQGRVKDVTSQSKAAVSISEYSGNFSESDYADDWSESRLTDDATQFQVVDGIFPNDGVHPLSNPLEADFDADDLVLVDEVDEDSVFFDDNSLLNGESSVTLLPENASVVLLEPSSLVDEEDIFSLSAGERIPPTPESEQYQPPPTTFKAKATSKKKRTNSSPLTPRRVKISPTTKVKAGREKVTPLVSPIVNVSPTAKVETGREKVPPLISPVKVPPTEKLKTEREKVPTLVSPIVKVPPTEKVKTGREVPPLVSPIVKVPPTEKVKTGREKVTSLTSPVVKVPPTEKVKTGREKVPPLTSLIVKVPPTEKVKTGREKVPPLASPVVNVPPTEKVKTGREKVPPLTSPVVKVPSTEKLKTGREKVPPLTSPVVKIPPTEKVKTGREKVTSLPSPVVKVPPTEKLKTGREKVPPLTSPVVKVPPTEKVKTGREKVTSLISPREKLPPTAKVKAITPTTNEKLPPISSRKGSISSNSLDKAVLCSTPEKSTTNYSKQKQNKPTRPLLANMKMAKKRGRPRKQTSLQQDQSSSLESSPAPTKAASGGSCSKLSKSSLSTLDRSVEAKVKSKPAKRARCSAKSTSDELLEVGGDGEQGQGAGEAGLLTIGGEVCEEGAEEVTVDLTSCLADTDCSEEVGYFDVNGEFIERPALVIAQPDWLSLPTI